MRAAILLAGLLLVQPNPGQAEDLTTLAGVTYSTVRLARVEPDGLTYIHALGVTKFAFTDLPEPLRRAYHFDPQRAAAYTRESAERAAAKAARDHQLIEAAEATKLAAATARAATATGTNASASSNSNPASGAIAPSILPPGMAAPVMQPSFSYGGSGWSVDRTTDRANRAVDEQVEVARQQAAIKRAATVWDSKLWRYLPIGLMDGRGREEFLLPSYLRRENAAIDTSISPPEVSSGR